MDGGRRGAGWQAVAVVQVRDDGLDQAGTNRLKVCLKAGSEVAGRRMGLLGTGKMAQPVRALVALREDVGGLIPNSPTRAHGCL